VLRQAFRLDTSKLPAYAGVENPQLEYTLVRVTRVQEMADLPPERAGEFTGALRQVLAQEAMAAYIASLKQKAGVTINREALEKREEGAPSPPASTAPDTPAPRRRGGL
jgi:peptidyl-prolyl cis-trans isomerase D